MVLPRTMNDSDDLYLCTEDLTKWRQRFGIDQHLDAPGDAGLASDQPAAFEREHHLVD